MHQLQRALKQWFLAARAEPDESKQLGFAHLDGVFCWSLKTNDSQVLTNPLSNMGRLMELLLTTLGSGSGALLVMAKTDICCMPAPMDLAGMAIA